MRLEEEVSKSIDNPENLERLFHSGRTNDFKKVIQKFYAADPSNPILACWNARLSYFDGRDTADDQEKLEPAKGDLFLTITLCIFAGIYAKLPDIFPFIPQQNFYAANIPFFVFSALIAFFVIANRLPNHLIIGIATSFGLCLIYSNVSSFLYTHEVGKRLPDTLILSGMHLPFVLWSILGVSFLGKLRNDSRQIINFLSYNAEALIYSGLILIGGVVLTVLTFSLFSAVNIDIRGWYLRWVVVFGSVSAPIVATYISINRFVLSGKIAPLLAKIFSPLFLATLVPYLVVLAAQGKSPFTDRDSLIVFNSMLLGALTVSVFSIVERSSEQEKTFSDYVNAGLISAALAINVIALPAIVFRLAAYGFTPNRVAVLGLNILIFIHLAMLLKTHFAFLTGKGTMNDIHNEVARYLPAYSIWSVFVVFILPLIWELVPEIVRVVKVDSVNSPLS